jgi:hypothetical protein
MASVGDAIARGGLPYRDGWDMKGPLAFAPFALATLLFGHAMWGVRIVDLAIVAPALFILYRTVGRLTTPAVGAGAALALYLWFASAGWFFTAQPEVWAAMAVSTGVCQLLRPEPWRLPKGRTLLLVGVLMGCAGLVKPHYLALFAAAPLSSLAAAPGLSLTQRARGAAWLTAGAALPVALIAGYIAARGGLASALEVHVLYTLSTYAGLDHTPKELLHGLASFFARPPVTILILFAALGLWIRRGERTLAVPLAVWIAGGLCGVLAQGKLYTYHWFPLYPPLVIAGALGVHALWDAARSTPATRALAAAAVALFAAYVAASPARDVILWGKLMADHGSRAYYDSYRRNTYSADDEVRAARYIEEHTGPRDGVFVWGEDATVRYLARRPSPTRFTFNLPLTIKGPFEAPYRAELMAALSNSPPAYIVVGSLWETIPKAQSFAQFPEFSSFLRDRYVFEVAIGNLDLYRRAEDVP